MRMTPERFEHLLSLVGPRITKTNTRMREAISAAERLILTLRYLASGDDQQSLSFSYRIRRTTVSHIIKETLYAIWLALKDKYTVSTHMPQTEEEFKQKILDMEEFFKFPCCWTAIDGCHIPMKCPPGGLQACKEYHNFKNFYSIVLMAMVDSHYRFV
ncbi:unnamed protein product [Pocillopora meandrina]|uniref:Nuclease HARBI1 n=1 Tax=Pocillopora meandrina TaxID=46732 RepID=A0AAU9WSU4_9CNID|nr:unnamed protein product [Pocillopora meandrina]